MYRSSLPQVIDNGNGTGTVDLRTAQKYLAWLEDEVERLRGGLAFYAHGKRSEFPAGWDGGAKAREVLNGKV